MMFGRKKDPEITLDGAHASDPAAQIIEPRGLPSMVRLAGTEKMDDPSWNELQERLHERLTAVQRDFGARLAKALEEVEGDFSEQMLVLAERAKAASEELARTRTDVEGRIRTLTAEVAQAKESTARRSREIETEVVHLKDDLAAREKALKAATEENAILLRRLEGFEGIKRAFQSL